MPTSPGSAASWSSRWSMRPKSWSATSVVANADLADIGVILGTGFAPFLGGPMQARRDGKA